ncbi:rotatin isoform X2 [Zootermopsis nevadensis]|uniref:rotatin isoform X2 n=1 Tax=Zootermopsis nevadensis TaxID=136037 RepID=UPI000B8E6D61|nr:rotatin isoform X2 [Zootermopsis nevadensis]
MYVDYYKGLQQDMPGNLTGSVLSTIQIEKLGHSLEEIRLRALNSVVSKLEYGFVSEKELIAQKSLVEKLLNWFNFETCPEAEKVLNLILRLIKSDVDGTLHMLVKTEGSCRVLDAIRTKVEPRLVCLVDEIVTAVDRNELEPRVTDLKENSRPSTGRQEASQRSVGTTATPVDVQVEGQQVSEDLHLSPSKVPHQHSHGYFSSGNATDEAAAVRSQEPSCFRCLLLPWQPLVVTDRHVLLSIEESLASTTDLPFILHTCQFFTDVMLQDFPAEVFLQRPAIIKAFFDLLNSDSRVCDIVACCLCRLTAALRVRVRYYSDPGITNLKQATCDRPDSSVSSASYMSGHPSATLNTDKSVTGNDVAQCNQESAGYQGYQQNAPSEAGYSSETTEDSVLLQLQQLTLPQYCLLCLLYTVPHLGPSSGSRRQTNMNCCVLLAAELAKLLAMCIKPSVWFFSDSVAQDVKEHLTQVLMLVGEVLEKHRSVGVYEEANRLTYLQILALTRKLLVAIVPVSVGDSVLHQKFKSVLCGSLIDLSVIAFFPMLHTDILQYVKAFHTLSDADCFARYETAMMICASMKAAVKFLKNHNKLERESFVVLDESLPSLPFHGNLDIVRHCVEIAVNKLYHMSFDESSWKVVTGVILKLLAHSEPNVRLEMYSCCHKYVVVILGVQQVSQMSVDGLRQLDFLCDTAVLIEIITHGAASLDKKIQQYSEEILIHLLKGKFLLPEPAWRSFLERLIPALPLLQCYADKTTSLGRTVVKIFEPETSQSIYLPMAEVLKGNLRLLFCSDPLTREEAVSRLTWIMNREERAFEKLPDFSSLRGLLLNSVCLTDRPVDLDHRRMQQHFYQVSSLCQVVELLKSKGVEPAVRRSALTQISVMLEDHTLHDQFLEQDGLDLILDILHKALVDKERSNSPDSVIPCVSVLKSMVLYSTKLRQELSRHASLFSCIVRAVYLYSGDDRLRSDSSVLLCLLLYSDFILCVPEPASSSSPWHRFSLPDLVARHMRLPFLCHTHWHSSHHTQHSEKRELLKDEGCCSLLRLCWNVQWFGGVEVVLNWSEVPPNAAISEDKLSGFACELRLLEGDLRCLKATAVVRRCKQHFYDIQNATTHQAVLKAVNCVTGYLALHILVSGKMNCHMEPTLNFLVASQLESSDWWHDLPWADTFKRFLAVSPASTEDQQLLVSVLELLQLYLSTCCRRKQGVGELVCQGYWITKILKDATQPLPNHLLRIAAVASGTDDDCLVSKQLCREILKLVQECSSHERKLEEAESAVPKKSAGGDTGSRSGSWTHIIQAVTQNLTFSDTQTFYNLAFLDWMLSCLAHLTSTLGWTDHPDGHVHRLWSELISCLTELVTAFPCGKDGAGVASFMGVSITRNAMLCMNHLLCEMQHSTSNKGWETVWLCSLGAETHAAGQANLMWLPPLWMSRDTVVRSAALQLVAGFCLSHQGCEYLLSGLSTIAGGMWGAGLSFLLDHEEACLVREQAAILLTNLSSHSTGGATLSLFRAPLNSAEVPLTGVQALESLLSQCNFYGEVATVLSRLCMGRTVDPNGFNRADGWSARSSFSQQVPPEEGIPREHYSVVCNRNSESSSSIDPRAPAKSFADGSLHVESHVKTTPGLVKAVCWLLVNLLTLSPDDALHRINKFSLVRLLFSCLVAGVPQQDTCDISVLQYVDILEMQTAICCILSKCVLLDETCLSTVVGTHDFVRSLLVLLDPVTYSTPPQLVFLRNQLWTELFKLFSAVLSGKQGFETVQDNLFQCGPWPYFSTLMTAIETDLSADLRYAALTSFTSVMSQEIRTRSVPGESCSLQNILDDNFSVPEEQDSHTAQHSLLPLGQMGSFQYETVFHRKGLVSSKHSVKHLRIISESDEQKHLSSDCQSAAGETESDSSRSITNYKNKNMCHSSKESKGKLDADMNESPSVRTEGGILKNEALGARFCSLLLKLYEVHSLPQGSDAKGKTLVTAALSSLLAVSAEAKKAALRQGLLETLVIQLRELHVRLSLESAENLRRVSAKKKVCPVLRDVGILFTILTNFLNGDSDVKVAAAEMGLADVMHKLWVWCCALPSLLEDALKMLSTFTTLCLSATQSLVLTTTVVGVGLRKTPSSLSLLHEIVSLVHREMEALNCAHEARILSLSFQILTNSCQSQECRNVIAKSTLFQCLPKLHPSLTKKQKHWEEVELIWLEFMSDFTFHSEGQLAVPKITDAVDLLISLAASSKVANKMAALYVLRNISFHHLNRPRLLGSGEFLQMLHQKLGDGTPEEKTVAASMVWALVANYQKGKLVIKCAGIDKKLQEAYNQLRLLSASEDNEADERICIIRNALQIIYAENSTARRR